MGNLLGNLHHPQLWIEVGGFAFHLQEWVRVGSMKANPLWWRQIPFDCGWVAITFRLFGLLFLSQMKCCWFARGTWRCVTIRFWPLGEEIRWHDPRVVWRWAFWRGKIPFQQVTHFLLAYKQHGLVCKARFSNVCLKGIRIKQVYRVILITKKYSRPSCKAMCPMVKNRSIFRVSVWFPDGFRLRNPQAQPLMNFPSWLLFFT